MSLAQYKRKRHFDRTPEPRPAGKKATTPQWTFVVQKHAASRLHYDFRLELDGTLKSWAVPKGPSLDPRDKRLAVHVEDHPLEYGSFEGVIPAGEYGGGTVLLWDRGTWEPRGDPHADYRDGKLKFKLHGEKLRGGWMLVRTRGRGSSATGEEWLLIKERDADARPSAKGDILDLAPQSVASGRELDAIATARDHVWGTQATAKAKRKTIPQVRKTRLTGRKRPQTSLAGVAGANKQRMPATTAVQLATLTTAAPDSDEWLHEIKFDGYRMLCRIDNGQVEFISRNQQDWTSRLQPLATAAKQLSVQQCILDGEVCSSQADGTTNFQALQNAFRAGHAQDLQYFVFDLLYLDGYSLVDSPLEERKRVLAELLAAAPPSRAIRYSEHVVGSGSEFARNACKLNLEGIVSKRADRPYRRGRGLDWLKVKCLRREEFVIGGYTDPSGSREGFGALLIGSYDQSGKLIHAGKVGTGFDAQKLRSLLARLQPLEQADSPFHNLRRKVGGARAAHWVKPKLVAQVAYANRTREGLLRHPAFLGLREDKPANEVVDVQALPISEAVRGSQNGTGSPRVPRTLPSSGGKNGRIGGKNGRIAMAPDASRRPSPSEGYDARRQEFWGVRLTSPEKILYPADGITKLQLANYYRSVADWILPHIVHRPLVLVRCPDGLAGECFYQKHPRLGTPDTLRRIPIREASKTEDYVVVDDVEGLIALAQVGALEIHAWGSREDKLERPDRLVFDLDPAPDVAWPRVVASAREVRAFLQELGLASFVKTSGGKGLHVVVPIDRRHDWDEAKSFCKRVAGAIAVADPEHYVAHMTKAARHGKIFIDYLRNARGATAVVPYSTRARPAATVSTPLAWEELSPRIDADKFTIGNLPRRLATIARDPWDGLGDVRQSLSRAAKKLPGGGTARS